MRGKYLLFDTEGSDNVEFHIPKKDIKMFIQLWNDGVDIRVITRQIRVTRAVALLIAIDLELSGQIDITERSVIRTFFDKRERDV